MRVFLKKTLFALALVAVSPLVFLAWLEARISGPHSEHVFSTCKEMLAAVPTIFGQYFRAAFYWASCTRVSWDVSLQLGAMIAHRRTIIGRRVVVGGYSILGSVEIGDDVLLGAHVSLLSGKYQHGRPRDHELQRDPSSHFETIHIGEKCWIGQGAIVMANVGRGSVIAAGAVVYRNVPPDSTMVGNPARRVDQAVRALEQGEPQSPLA